MDLDIYIMEYLFKLLDVKTEIFYDWNYNFEGKKNGYVSRYV